MIINRVLSKCLANVSSSLCWVWTCTRSRRE